MGYPYYQRFPRDFFEGTIGMTFEVKAAYGLLIDLIFIRDGRLPDDARFIAGHLGLSVRKWNTIRETLLSWPNADGTIGKISSDLGIISTLRSDNLTINRRLSRDNNEINKPPPNENNDLQKPHAGVRAGASKPEPEPEEEGADDRVRDVVDDWPDGSDQDHADSLCAEANTVHLDKSRESGLTVSAGRIHAWRRDGASWERDVRPVVLSIAGRAKAPIKTWAYFDRAVAEAKANNNRALPEGDQHGNGTSPGRSRRDDDIHAMLEGARQAVNERNAELSGGGRIDRRVS